MAAMANYAATSTSTSNQRPRLNGHKSPADGVARTKILLLGLRRAGKTSIQQVLFNNLPPSQTFYLETTMRIVKHAIDTIIPLEIWDCPANTTVESLGEPLSRFSTIIFVIDIRDLYNQPISKLVEFIVASYAENPDIILEVFVHKAEKLQEDDKLENFRQIHGRVSDRLLDISSDYEQMQLNFHLTSVYDHSLHEAFSRVLHKLTESLPFLEELMNVFCANCQSPKAFLFDVTSRLYVATDASPVDSATHNLCCDYLLMLNSFTPLYKSITSSSRRCQQLTTGVLLPTPYPSFASFSSRNNSAFPSSSGRNPTFPTQEQSPRPNLSRDASPGPIAAVSPTSPAPPTTNGTSTPQSNSHLSNSTPTSSSSTGSVRTPKYDEKFYPYASVTTSMPSSTVGSGTTTITYHMITKTLALMALIPTAVFEERRGLVEYNVVFFREGVQEICIAGEEERHTG